MQIKKPNSENHIILKIIRGASWSSGLTRYHYDEAMQGSAVRNSAPLLFFRRSDSFVSPAGDQIRRKNEGRPRQDEVKKRRRGIPAGGKGGRGDEGGSGLDSKVE